MNINEFRPSEHSHVAELLYRNARKYPNKDAVLFNGASWTYEELDQASNQIANALILHGVQKQDRIAMMMSNSEKFIMLYFGILKAGAVVVPVNAKFRRAEVLYLLADSGAKMLMMEERFSPLLMDEDGTKITLPVECVCMASTAEVPNGTVSFQAILGDAETAAPQIVIEEDDWCCILYTSGTTGAPSGALFTHRKVMYDGCVAGAINHKYHFYSRCLIMMPLFHSAPLHNHLLGCFFTGGTVVVTDGFTPELFLETIEKQRITHFFGPSLVYLSCIRYEDPSKYDLSSMELFIMGGSTCSSEDMSEIIRSMKLEGRFAQVYGLTEAGPFGSILCPEDVRRKSGTIGLSGSIGAELYIVDEGGNVITEAGIVGEIVVFSESNMVEYFGNPTKTASTLVNGWILTGDLAQYDEDGYTIFVDRKKDVLISGGQNIYPKEIEDVLMRHPAIQEAAVIGIPHKEWGESVKAIICLKPGCVSTVEEIKAYCRNQLASFKLPRYVEFVDEIPHNPAGKVVKLSLRERFGLPQNGSVCS